MKNADIRCFPSYEAAGPEAEELRAIADEAIADALAPEVVVVNSPPAEEVEEEWLRIGDNL